MTIWSFSVLKHVEFGRFLSLSLQHNLQVSYIEKLHYKNMEISLLSHSSLINFRVKVKWRHFNCCCLEMGELRGMIPIEALQFPQSYEANFKLKRTYHVKRERTRNKSEVSCWFNFEDFIKKILKIESLPQNLIF